MTHEGPPETQPAPHLAASQRDENDKASAPGSSTLSASVERYPLGLPAGSIRALVTILIVAFVVVQTARGLHVELIWNETLMIVLAHYFTSRRFIPLPADIRARLEAQGALERETNPLFLPRHSVRVLIVLSFAGLAVYLYRQNRFFETQSLSILGTVGAYFLGIFVKMLTELYRRWRGKLTPVWWIDLQAGATLGLVLLTTGLEMFGGSARPFEFEHLEKATLGLVLFYFGSR